MSRSAVVRPQAVVLDRWETVRCAQGRRLYDVNHARREVRIWCDRCRVTHTLDVGVGYTDSNR